MIPIVRSADPNWDVEDRRQDALRLERGELLLADGHQTLATTVLEGEAEEELHMPSESIWPFVLALASIIGALARRRSRRVAAAALAVVLVVFAVESAQHTVHHAFNDRTVACPTALIATHLNGTTVEGLAVDAPILLVGARLDSPYQRVSPLGSFALQHGRAPPSALA